MTDRLSKADTVEGDTSSGQRMIYYRVALEAVMERPILGLGIGGFAIYHWGVDQRQYPHNIFLEVGSELGFLGLGLFVLLVGGAIVILLTVREAEGGPHDGLNVILTGLLFFQLVNALFTGDVNDNRFLFVVLGTIFATAAWTRKVTNKGTTSLNHNDRSSDFRHPRLSRGSEVTR